MTERLTAERLRELMHYDPLSGLFTRLVRTSNNTQVGDIAGSVNGNGYLHIRVDWKNYKAHRLAWLYMVGEFPENDIDHRNGVRTDNRWSNLREATRHENMMNVKKRNDNKSGFKGVYWHKIKKKWKARINFDGRGYILGYFDTPEEASAYYEGAASICFGNFKRIIIIES